MTRLRMRDEIGLFAAFWATSVFLLWIDGVPFLDAHLKGGAFALANIGIVQAFVGWRRS
jgi:hypothetical protein